MQMTAESPKSLEFNEVLQLLEQKQSDVNSMIPEEQGGIKPRTKGKQLPTHQQYIEDVRKAQAIKQEELENEIKGDNNPKRVKALKNQISAYQTRLKYKSYQNFLIQSTNGLISILGKVLNIVEEEED